MINDLNTVSSDLWKYVDDTTLTEVVPRGECSNVQMAVNDMVISPCLESRIQFYPLVSLTRNTKNT